MSFEVLLLIAVGVVVAFFVYTHVLLRPDYKPNAKYLPNPAADRFVDQGVRSEHDGDLDNALALYTKAIELSPYTVFPAYMSRANVYLYRNQYDLAIQDCETALRIFSGSYEAYLLRGSAYFRKLDWASAVRDFNLALHFQLRPHEMLFLERAWANYKLGNEEEAFADVKRAMESFPQSAAPYNTRGSIFHDKRDFKAAVLNYSKAIDLNPPDADRHYELRGLAQMSLGNYDDAIDDLNRALQINANVAERLYNLAYTYWKKEDFNSASEVLKDVFARWPNFDHAFNLRGYLRAVALDFKAALEDLNRAVELNPQYPPFYNSRAGIYFAFGQLDRALEDFKTAYELSSKEKFATGGLAVTHHAMGNVDQAQALWRTLLAKDTQFKNPDWVKKELEWLDPLVDEARKLIAGL